MRLIKFNRSKVNLSCFGSNTEIEQSGNRREAIPRPLFEVNQQMLIDD